MSLNMNLKGKLNRSVIGSVLLVGIILAMASYVVGRFRRPGSMTPIEAQSMEMELPAPAGIAPVELATVERGRIESVVRANGQAVGYVEEDVAPRVTGTIVWMPFYAGDRVRRGQLLARLDTSQSAPQVANQRAMLDIAIQGVGVARKEYQQTMAAIKEAHAEVGMKTGAVAGARAELTAAKEERANAAAELDSANSMTADAGAQLESAQADQRYWKEEIDREAGLLKAGAVTREEYQRERAQAENVEGKVRQAQARIVQVAAQIRAAQAAVRKAEALAVAASSKLDETQAELNSHFAHVNSTQAMSDSARQKIAQAEAGVEQARAALAGAGATQGYSEIRSETDGVVTQRIVSPGVLVNPGQTLLRIAQVTPIRLQANITETDLQKIAVGSPVRVIGRGGGGKPLTARITSRAPSIDAVSRTAVVEAVVPNRDGRFLPGQYVTLEVSTGSDANALHIPTRALRYHTAPSGDVLSSQSTPTVWAVDPITGQDGQFTAREVAVRTGLSDGDRIAILDGLKAGQRVIVTGQDYLKNGDTVGAVGTQLTAARADSATMPNMLGMPGMRQSANTGMSLTHGASQPLVSAHAPAHVHYTCIMHPEIDLDHPGNCPKCGMKLVPKRTGGAR